MAGHIPIPASRRPLRQFCYTSFPDYDLSPIGLCLYIWNECSIIMLMSADMSIDYSDNQCVIRQCDIYSFSSGVVGEV